MCVMGHFKMNMSTAELLTGPESLFHPSLLNHSISCSRLFNQSTNKTPKSQTNFNSLITPLFLSYPICSLSHHSDLWKYVIHIMSFPRSSWWLSISLKVIDNSYNNICILKLHNTSLCYLPGFIPYHSPCCLVWSNWIDHWLFLAVP